jgi:predicted Zn-dependent protease
MFGQMARAAADEGRSFFSRPAAATGSASASSTSASRSVRPQRPALFTAPFNAEGLPEPRMVWFDRGTLREPGRTTASGRSAGREPTGFAAGFMMEGGDATIEQMIASTERGLLVTRFWYMRPVDQRTILYTGLTRDGTFLIENGRITRPVQNLRWNESPINLLNNIEMMGASAGFDVPVRE